MFSLLLPGKLKSIENLLFTKPNHTDKTIKWHRKTKTITNEEQQKSTGDIMATDEIKVQSHSDLE